MPQAERMRHAAEHRRLIEAVDVFEDQAELAHQTRILELRVGLCHEHRIIVRKMAMNSGSIVKLLIAG